MVPTLGARPLGGRGAPEGNTGVSAYLEVLHLQKRRR